MNYLALTVFVVAMSSCSALDLRPYNLTAYQMFIVNDYNFDGEYTRDEMDHTFKIYDSDANGRVTRKEYTTYVHNSTPTLEPLSQELFHIYDVDGDHFLDAHDFDNFFRLMDFNEDSIVTPGEFIHYWSILLERFEHIHLPTF